jgi:hypothetical protein
MILVLLERLPVATGMAFYLFAIGVAALKARLWEDAILQL